MTDVRPPSPRAQIAFLRNFQRILDEGSFVATYKFALLHAIADLCVVEGDDSGAALELGTRAIAERFVRLYWPQVVPYVSREDARTLRQNTGRQAAIVREIREAHERYQGSLPALERDGKAWDGLVRAVQRTVQVMPLWKLQTVGGEQLEFLYPNLGGGDRIRLEPGVAYCFRAFYPMLVEMIQGAWSHFVQRTNADLLEQVRDLRTFLFGSERTALAGPRGLLRELQEGACFYCGRAVTQDAAVDHFVPWRRYPLDLGHNLVLAHRGCNSSKSDLLAAEEHLERWASRNRGLGSELERAFDAAGIQHDLVATERVARWAYGQVDAVGGQVWVAGREMRELGEGWRGVLGFPVT